MPILKLSKRTVDALAPSDKRYVAWDADLTGFGCRVLPTGAKSWIVAYRPHGGGRSVVKKSVTLGSIGQLTADQARRAAAEMLAAVRLGSDPAAERVERREAMTVSGLIDAFVAEHITKLKATSAEGHRLALARLREAHGTMKASALTRSQVAALHSKMRDRPAAANRALAVCSKLFAWAGARGFVAENANPARGIERYREAGRERYLTSDELSRLGDALRALSTIRNPAPSTRPRPRIGVLFWTRSPSPQSDC